MPLQIARLKENEKERNRRRDANDSDRCTSNIATIILVLGCP